MKLLSRATTADRAVEYPGPLDPVTVVVEFQRVRIAEREAS